MTQKYILRRREVHAKGHKALHIKSWDCSQDSSVKEHVVSSPVSMLFMTNTSQRKKQLMIISVSWSHYFLGMLDCLLLFMRSNCVVLIKQSCKWGCQDTFLLLVFTHFM